MDMFENKIICGLYATEYIMSWIREGGTLGTEKRHQDYKDFREWLKTLMVNGETLSDKEVQHIMNLAYNGKLELEESASEFLKKL